MRRIKYFAGQHETQPIKDKREIDALYNYFIKRQLQAKSDIKKYQADRDYMLVHIGLNTAFRAEDLLQLRVADSKIQRLRTYDISRRAGRKQKAAYC